jgi:RNA polymerase sigma-70 factor (ECF subfamily)
VNATALGEHFFRRAYGRIVAMLSRRFGVRYLESAEDAAQSALLAAVESWTRDGPPENPLAWLYRAAHNALVEDLRREARRDRLLERHRQETPNTFASEPTASMPGDVEDDLLRMLFVCCDEAIPLESRLVLALKILCGFDVREIAERLFVNEATAYKRLSRGRSRLRDAHATNDEPSMTLLSARLPAVHAVLYVLFTEGYLSSRADAAIRRELCDEALRLAHLLAEHAAGRTPETFALVALMHLHRARTAARQDASGGLLLLEEQDRTRWDAHEVNEGLAWLARSAEGDVFSRYHAEAGIAAEHCLAPSFEVTRWKEIAELYAILEHAAPSPLHTLNRAVAIAEWQGPSAALALLDDLAPPAWLEGSYSWDAVLADLHGRLGHADAFRKHRDRALLAAPTDALRVLLRRRLSRGEVGGVRV